MIVYDAWEPRHITDRTFENFSMTSHVLCSLELSRRVVSHFHVALFSSQVRVLLKVGSSNVGTFYVFQVPRMSVI